MKDKKVKTITIDSFWKNNVGSVNLNILVFEKYTKYQVLNWGMTPFEEQEWIFQTYQEAKEQFDKLNKKGR